RASVSPSKRRCGSCGCPCDDLQGPVSLLKPPAVFRPERSLCGADLHGPRPARRPSDLRAEAFKRLPGWVGWTPTLQFGTARAHCWERGQELLQAGREGIMV